MLDWQSIPTTINTLVKEGSVMFARIREALRTLPSAAPGHGHVWFNPKTQHVFFALGNDDSSDTFADWIDKFRKIKGVKYVYGDPESHPPKDKGPWLLVKKADLQSVFRPVAQLGGWQEGFPANLMGGPNPVSATIASGILGAGAGYGLGWLGEKVMPGRVVDKDKARLRRSMAIIGGLIGAAPGVWSGTVNLRHGRSLLDPIGAEPKVASIKDLNKSIDRAINPNNATRLQMNKLADEYDRVNDFVPGGGALMGSGADFAPVINTDRFNRVVWDDPFTPTPIKGMTSGVLTGAAQVGGNSPYVSPMDVGRLAVGMGTGLASGLIVGKTLSALAGLSSDAQNALQRAGTFAGLLKNVVPMILPRSQTSQFEYVR